MSEYDYVVVGAGSAGCVLAARLSEQGARVALLEAGGSHRTLKIHAPGLYFTLWRSKHDWALTCEPQQFVDGRRMFWPRGKVLGGSGSLNASLYVRGHRADYDGWRDAGCTGWGWDDVKPVFERSLGEWPFEAQPEPSPAARAFVDALAARCGVKQVDDFNGGDNEGAGFYKVSCKGGERWSSARAFLDPARGRANLMIITGAVAEGLVVEGSRVVGVKYRVGGNTGVVKAKREVVIAAGAIGSPELLLRSGIGPAAHLKEVGVDVVKDLDGVGQNLQDHLLYTVNYEAAKGAAMNVTRLNLLAWMARYVAGKKGPFARSPIQSGGFVKTKDGLDRPDLQFHFAPLPTLGENFDEPRAMVFGSQLTILPTLIYPKSRGEIRLRKEGGVAIDPRYLAQDEDMATLVRGARLARELAESAEMKAVIGKELRPGAEAAGDEERLRASIRRHVDTIFHPVGTCAMGSVVDAQLRVQGVEGVRVADASVMPRIVGGNTNAPTVMIAERAAEMMLA